MGQLPQQGNPQMLPNQPGVQVSDPMSALRNMAGAPGSQQAQLVAAGIQPAPNMNQNPINNVVVPGGPQAVNPMAIPNNRYAGPPGGMMNTAPMMNQNMQHLHLTKLRRQVPHQMMQGANFNEFVNQQQQQNVQQSPGPQYQQFQGHSPLQNPAGQASPAAQMMQGTQMALSPVTSYVPSPTSQIVPSPVGPFPNRTPNVPSPGNVLMGTGPNPSPVSRTLTDEQLYLEKLKQLSKYIEPLRRVINRMDKGEGNITERKEISKMKNLLDILSDPNKKISMEVLLKCETVLERMDFKPKLNEGLPVGKTQEQNIFQPFLDVLLSNIKLPQFNHSLQRTFGPIVNSLFNHRTVPYAKPVPKRKVEKDSIPDIVQGEIARLDSRFKVQLDPSQHPGATILQMVCQLDDKNLPCVPPISITVPTDYPDHPPNCDILKIEEYETTPFLQRIQQIMGSRLDKMPSLFSITILLDAWEMSVRQACRPHLTDD